MALLAVADALARGGDAVTVFGSGFYRPGCAYTFRHVPAFPRERFERMPIVPLFRNETAWEDASFAVALLALYRPHEFDAVITCGFPFVHLALRRPAVGPRPKHVFVTQNGDWPAYSDDAEYALFRCDGLVCTNPDYFERNRARWRCSLIPNGVEPGRFVGASTDRAEFGLPSDRPLVLMVSALIESKRVLDAIRTVARHPEAYLVVAGDGPMREEVDILASALLPGRFKRVTLPAERMPQLYSAADAFLHLSVLESFGNVFVEAMASGLPVVAHDSVRLRWIVGDEQPLCNTHDPVALDNALSRALRHGRRAPDRRVEQFAWTKIASEYRSFIGELID